MRIVGRKKITDFVRRDRNAQKALQAWISETEQADWNSPSKVTEEHSRCSILGDNRVVFRVRGNRYRIVVKINYQDQMVFIRFVGNHDEYDRIDAEEI